MRLFSKTVDEKHVTYKLLGIKFSMKSREYCRKMKIERDRKNRMLKETKKEIAVQDSWDLTDLKIAKKLILFLVPSECKVNGGIMSIYSLCEASRKINKDSLCILSNYPNERFTYATNDQFLNNEKIYRFQQIVENCKNIEELILHIPEYYTKYFYNSLTENDKTFFKSIKKLQINIMNQNIEIMPELEEIKNLYFLTDNITQTIAHNRYATQEICDKYNMPTHLFSVNIDLGKYKSYSFEEKEKIIVLSPDENENKEKIVNKLKKELPDWQTITVQNLTFSEYMDLISRAYFTITFGEGMDGYFLQPEGVNSVGFAVYNDDFFPDNSWEKLENVYSSYDEMFNLIVKDIKELSTNKTKFDNIILNIKSKCDKIYNIDKFYDNLTRFYNKEYDLYPQI